MYFQLLHLRPAPGDAAILNRKPRDPKKPILTRALWIVIVGNGLSITAATLGALYLAIKWLGLSVDAAVTVSFLTIAFAQLLNVFNMRDPRAHLFKNDIVENPFVWAAIVFCTLLLLFVAYFPPVAGVLHLEPPDGNSWTVILMMSTLPVLVGQIGKEMSRILAMRRRAPVDS